MNKMAEKPSNSHYVNTFDFENEQEIGGGGQGAVFKVEHLLDGCFYAVKKVRFKDDSPEKIVVDEVIALARLDHPNVVRYHHSWKEKDEDNSAVEASADGGTGLSGLMGDLGFDNKYRVADGSDESQGPPPDTTLFVKMELCSSTLESWITRRNESVSCDSDLVKFQGEIKGIFKGVLSGLEHIHRKGIVHRDLKPANIFLSSNEMSAEGDSAASFIVKIGDFGLCKLRQGQYASADEAGGSDFAGTPIYVAPEFVNMKDYGCKVDIYSLGVIYLELCLRIMTGQELSILAKETRVGNIPKQLQTDQWSEEAGHLRNMLRFDPEERWSATDLYKSTLHQ